jgi:hypothetical protein
VNLWDKDVYWIGWSIYICVYVVYLWNDDKWIFDDRIGNKKIENIKNR